jgi:hypothetical protein
VAVWVHMAEWKRRGLIAELDLRVVRGSEHRWHDESLRAEHIRLNIIAYDHISKRHEITTNVVEVAADPCGCGLGGHCGRVH